MSKRKAKQQPLVKITKQEQERLIKQSGVLDKVVAKDDPFFTSILYTIPFSVVYLTLYMVVHQEYNEPIDLYDSLQNLVRVLPMLFLFIYLTVAYGKFTLVKLLLAGASTSCGCYLLLLIKSSPAMGIMMQAPGLATLWIYTVTVMDLGSAVASLMAVGSYYLFVLNA
jgi:hypothetical protein